MSCYGLLQLVAAPQGHLNDTSNTPQRNLLPTAAFDGDKGRLKSLGETGISLYRLIPVFSQRNNRKKFERKRKTVAATLVRHAAVQFHAFRCAALKFAFVPSCRFTCMQLLKAVPCA